MKNKEIKNNSYVKNYTNSPTSTNLQNDVGNTDTSISKYNPHNIELIRYKIDEHDKKIDNIENVLKKINMPLIDKINKYKTIFQWGAGIISVLLGAITTVSVILFNLYNNSIQTHFDNLEEKLQEISKNTNELKLEIREMSKKQNSLEIKIIENKKDTK